MISRGSGRHGRPDPGLAVFRRRLLHLSLLTALHGVVCLLIGEEPLAMSVQERQHRPVLGRVETDLEKVGLQA
jgi:hypothetical protein